MKKQPTRDSRPYGLPEGFCCRAYPVSPKSLDKDAGTVEAVMATEAPAMVWDWDRYAVVSEVLLLSGLKNKKPGTQLPLLDSHNRDKTEDQIGSTEIRGIEGDKLIGVRRFSRVNPRAQIIAGMIAEGHVTDGSIGYIVDRSVWIDEGKSKVIGGREFTGPLKIGTAWRLLEDSVTPIGADPGAKMREMGEASSAEPETIDGKEDGMDAIRESLVALGLKAEATDDEVRDFLRKLQKPAPEVDVDAVKAEADKAATERERTRATAIRELALLAGNRDLGDKLVTDGASVDEARKALVEAARAAGTFGGAPVTKPKTEDKDVLDTIDNKTFADSLCRASLYS